jgi:hypothetical protein
MAIASITLIFSTSIPEEFHALLSSTYFALASAMACRVFRAVLLGITKDPRVNTFGISSVIGATNINGHGDDTDTTVSRYNKSKLSSNDVGFMKDTSATPNESTVWEQGSAGDDIRNDASRQVEIGTDLRSTCGNRRYRLCMLSRRIHRLHIWYTTSFGVSFSCTALRPCSSCEYFQQ